MNGKMTVEYMSGESRTNPSVGVDYMIATIGDTELYAEAAPIDGDETGTYEALLAEIMDQAARLAA